MTAVGAVEAVGAGVGRDRTRHTRHPHAVLLHPPGDHEMLVDELGGREALSLVGASQSATSEAMAALFDGPAEDDSAEGPFLGEGDDRDDAVLDPAAQRGAPQEGLAGEARIAGAAVDDTMDFWSELDAAQNSESNSESAVSTERRRVPVDDKGEEPQE